MAHLQRWAQCQPEKVAIRVIGPDASVTPSPSQGEQREAEQREWRTEQAVTFAELDRWATRGAHWLISLGLDPGDGVAALLENRAELIELFFAARRAGLYFTPMSVHLAADEVAYILRDSGAKALVTSRAMAGLASSLGTPPALGQRCFMLDGAVPGFHPLEEALARASDGPLPERPLGRDMLYSSGTTGHPKGIRRGLIPYANRLDIPPSTLALRDAFGFSADMLYLSPGPLYHAAPLAYVTRVLEAGGGAVIMRRFDAAAALGAIEQYRVTHSQWVPTMFVRLLALPEQIRNRHDLSSQRFAIHAAAPCPPEIKRRMIEWWGPVIYEYYAGSEGVGTTAINSADWLAHPSSVGRPIHGTPHILDDEGRELGPGEIGRIFFSGGVPFEYHNAPDKTAASRDAQGRMTYGDLGHLDSEGYLYLSGRRADLILSGGVNIYPQEIENVLATHPAVADVAVIGVPNAEYGEEVKALVQLVGGRRAGATPAAGPELAADIIAFCRARLSHVKCPRSVEFVDALPRLENGKLLKRLLKQR